MAQVVSRSASMAALLQVAACCGAVLLPLLSRASVDEILPLPTWTEEDVLTLREQPEALPLSGLLWPDGFNADSIMPPIPHLATGPEGYGTDPGRNASAGVENFLLFIPKRTSTEQQRVISPETELTEVTREFLEQSESMEPEAFLLDPHMLLGETQSEDLRRLLAYHVSQAQTSAYFLMLDTHEKLSPKVDLSRLAGGRLTREHACLAAYPLGQPWRARLFVTREIATGVKAGYLPGILEACVQDAMRASDPVEQLQRFATQLSIRLIWMERAYPRLFAPEKEAAAAEAAPGRGRGKAANAQAKDDPPQALVLADVSQPLILEENATRDWKQLLRTHGVSVLLGCCGLFLLLAAWQRFRQWRRKLLERSVWLLPEVETQPRFGGAHCGSGGVWMKYGSPE